MNTGQMLLVIAALVLLSTIALSLNNTLLDSDRVSVEAQSGILAVSLCRGEIEDLVATDFDSLAVGSSLDTLFTPYAAFTCSTSVGFVQAAAPDNPVVGPTNLKRVVVTVSNDYMTGSVTLRAVVGDF